MSNFLKVQKCIDEINKPAINELKPIPSHKTMPDCGYGVIGPIREVHISLPDGSKEVILQALYEDGWDNPFWGPIPQITISLTDWENMLE
jgi:hypothetical protein